MNVECLSDDVFSVSVYNAIPHFCPETLVYNINFPYFILILFKSHSRFALRKQYIK